MFAGHCLCQDEEVPVKAWHFLREDRCLGYGDNREVIAGETYTVDGPSELCVRGLHGSKRPLDALRYAPGPVVCRVEIGGDVVEGDDKIVGTTREVLWMYDATEVLREFARFCALDVVPYWDPPDVVLAWLQTGDESLCNDAHHAAHAAARAADAAADVAYYAADVAHCATDVAQNTRLRKMLMEGGPHGRS